MKPSLIVHGGAWDIPDDAIDACKSGCHSALSAAWPILASGGSALDAVEAAIVVLEDHPVFDAGYGSHLNRDGHVECDAIVMDGATLKTGAAAGLQRLKNPIKLARKILEHSPHMMLIADGAERFAKAQGLALCNPEELVSEAEWEAFLKCSKDEHAYEHHRGHEQGTVGAVAIDQSGHLFAATSTGGTCCKHPGRVGDSPLIGCGCYADSAVGGVSCTGYGEAIMKILMAKSAADFLRTPFASAPSPNLPSPVGAQHIAPNLGTRSATGDPLRSADPYAVQNSAAQSLSSPTSPAMQAAREAIHLLASRTRATGGLILLDRDGHPGFAFNTPRMAHGYIAPDGTFLTSV
jgi:beta-aspartyl-peptidase (threonine type)